MPITQIKALEILDSRGNPTIEVRMSSKMNSAAAMVPSGASTGIYEALELRDGGRRYNGKGVLKAAANVNHAIAKKLIGRNPFPQSQVDNIMIKLDGTKNKSRLGANAIIGASMAACRLAAKEKKEELYDYIKQISKTKTAKLPVPFANIINGGRHASGKLKMQEFMIAPVKAKSFTDAECIVSETYHILRDIIIKKYGKNAVGVGDEGGFAPPINNAHEALNLLVKAIHDSGYTKETKIAMDPAASEFYNKKTKKYEIEKKLSGEEMIDYYLDLLKRYPICSLEDPFEQDDFQDFAQLTKKIKAKYGKSIQIVGDDLLVTNASRIKIALKKKLCNALLLKVNQIGTVTEAIAAANLAMKNGWNVMVSHRSGETSDTFISDLSVGLGCGQIKIGAPCRGERTAKYNRLLEIETRRRLKYAKW